MMHTFISFMFPLFIWVSPGKPVADANMAQMINVSLRSGDADRLATRFARTIELVIDAERVAFTAIQVDRAQLILRAFFQKYPPRVFQCTYQGTADRLRYTTGTYESNGKQFSVYILMRQTANQPYVINALHIRKE